MADRIAQPGTVLGLFDRLRGAPSPAEAQLGQERELFREQFQQQQQLSQQRYEQQQALQQQEQAFLQPFQQARTGLLEAQTQAQQVETQLMPLDFAQRASELNRDAIKQGIKITTDIRKELNGDPVVQKTQTALTSYGQLLSALQENNQIALQSAIVALVQVQEPGLAVRNDDRVAYTGNNEASLQLANAYNRWVTGEATPEIAERMRRLGTALAREQAMAGRRVLEDFEQIALQTPGADPELALLGTGIDPVLLDALTAQ